jgi:multimeric flavodoxin WrbA
MAGPRIIGINGSARSYGNTFRLLRVALAAAEEAGAETELIHLYRYRINPCQACYSDHYLECHYPKKCPLYEGYDDYHMLAEKILAADGVIIATPVYWFNASGAVKNLVDRMTSLENMIYHVGRSLLDGKVAGFIAAGEEAGAAMALSWLTFTFNMMGVHIPAWGTAYYHGKGDALLDEQAVSDAYNVGSNVVRLVRVLRGEEKPPEKWYRFLGKEEIESLRRLVSREAEENRRGDEARRPWLAR